MMAGAVAFIDKGWMQPRPLSDGSKESGKSFPSSFSVSGLDLGGLFEGTRGGG